MSSIDRANSEESFPLSHFAAEMPFQVRELGSKNPLQLSKKCFKCILRNRSKAASILTPFKSAIAEAPRHRIQPHIQSRRPESGGVG